MTKQDILLYEKQIGKRKTIVGQEVKKAQEIIRNGWGTPKMILKDFLDAQDAVCDAIQSGYTLCKVDEVIEKIKAESSTDFLISSFDVIAILRGSCE